jgi:ribosomal protein S18 acetylase RimI-like enzyme
MSGLPVPPAEPQNIQVVEADLSDERHQRHVVEMVNAYARDPMGRGGDLPAAVMADLIPGLRRHPTSLIFLAYDGGRPVGVAVCFLGFSTFAARPLINIHDLSVIPGYRGRGVGRRLLEHVEAKGRALNCAKITLEVNAENRVAQKLYVAYGFGDGKADGTIGRMWFLQKPL